MRSLYHLRLFRGRLIYGLLVILSVFVLAGCSGSGKDSGKSTVVNSIGAPVIDFTIKTFDGKEFTLSDHSGGPVLINFWASWCGPCRSEGPLMESLYRKYGPRGMTFVGIAVDDSEKGSRRYLKEMGWTFPAGPDTDGAISKTYNVMGIPKTFIIKSDGTVSYIQSGVMPELYLSNKIEEVLAP